MATYTPPGVSIQELATPSVSPVLDRPTSIALVGKALGYKTYTEYVTLEHNTAVPLVGTNIDVSTLTVASENNLSATFVNGGDYALSAPDADGRITIKRRIPSVMAATQDVVVVTTSSDGTPAVDEWFLTLRKNKTGYLTTDVNQSAYTIIPSDANTIAALVVQNVGRFAAGDYTYNSGSNNFTRNSTIVAGQTVYVSYRYTSSGVTYQVWDEALVMPSAVASANLAHSGVDSTSIIVTNKPGVASGAPGLVTLFSAAASAGNTGDYLLSGDLPRANTTVTQNATTTANLWAVDNTSGYTNIGAADDGARVVINYRAVPIDYFAPTRMFSLADVEEKYGPSLDINGNIVSPLSFGAMLAFANGAPDVVCQALFHVASASDITTYRTPSGSAFALDDWKASLLALQDVDDVNVLVPIVSETIDNSKSVFAAVQDHIKTMLDNQQYIVTVLGLDATVSTNGVTQTALQATADYLAGRLVPHHTTLVSPGSYKFPNPRGGTAINVGGQYVACALAGMLALRSIQIPLTRKSLTGIIDVNDFRSEMSKIADAEHGLTVIENKNGVVRVRHALTLVPNDASLRELSVIRSKGYLIESLRNTIDTQIIGQIVVDDNATFIVEATVQAVLENLQSQGIIVNYSGLQTRSLAPTLPSIIEVRFSYKPAYPLNYVNIVFSIDTTSGTIETTGV